MRAARALVWELNEKAWEEVSAGRSIEPSLAAELRAASVLATDTAVDVATQALRYGGGAALFLDNMLGRLARKFTISS